MEYSISLALMRKNIIKTKSRLYLIYDSPNGSWGSYDHDSYWLLDDNNMLHVESYGNKTYHKPMCIKEEVNSDNSSVTYQSFNCIYLLPNYLLCSLKGKNSFIIKKYDIKVNIIDTLPNSINSNYKKDNNYLNYSIRIRNNKIDGILK